jgi:dTMP kinase
LDGSGKTTQWKLLQSRLDGAVFVTFPDYDSASGRIIGSYLNGEFGESGANPYAVSSFYAVDRFISHAASWGKSLRGGLNVVCARYTSSNAIYQMAKLPEAEWAAYLDWLHDYEHGKLNLPRPDLTVYLDVPLVLSRELLRGRATTNDIHESDEAYREKCRAAAMFVAQRESWTKINCAEAAGAMRAADEINDELLRIISEALC